MTSRRTMPSPDDLTLLDRVVRDVARARRLSPEDAEDFAQSVQLRLLETHYEIFARFAGRSSLRTYLAVVVGRLLLDWRNSRQGKWRPSAAAVRLGPHAIAIDRLMHRDGHPKHEAIAMVHQRDGAPAVEALQRMADALPSHGPRRMVTDEGHEHSRVAPFDDPIEAKERRRRQYDARLALRRAIEQMPIDDQRLLRLRFQRQWSVAHIANVLGMDPKPLYRRFARMLHELRQKLTADDVARRTLLPSKP